MRLVIILHVLITYTTLSLALPRRRENIFRQEAVCYYNPIIVFDPIPLSDAANQCTANGFTLTEIPPSGQLANVLSSIFLSNFGTCATPPTTTIALPDCSYFNIALSTGFPATNCGMLLPVMCILPPPPILTNTITVTGSTTTVTDFSTSTVSISATSTVTFTSATTSFIVIPSATTTTTTLPLTNTISFGNTVSTTTTITLQNTVVISSISSTTTTTTDTFYSISQTTLSSTLTLTRTLTLRTSSTTTTTTTTCPPTSFSTRTQTSTVTATATVTTVVPTITTASVTVSTVVTRTESVCGGTANPPCRPTIPCPPGKRCPQLPKRCLSYGQVQTCRHRDRKLLVAFKPASYQQADCVCQAVGGALAVLDGQDDMDAAEEVVYECVGSGGRAWVGQVLKDDSTGEEPEADSADEHKTCPVVRAIDRDFGLIEDQPCKSKYPILCRYW